MCDIKIEGAVRQQFGAVSYYIVITLKIIILGCEFSFSKKVFVF